MTKNLHAHVSTFSRDCDGGHGDEYITRLNADELAEHARANGVNDFHDLNFKERVLGNIVSFHPEQDAEVHITREGFRYSEPTDEGFRSAEVTWCEEECEAPRNTVYDEYARAAGY